MQVEQVVVLDNGGGTIKIGFTGESEPRKVFPNCTAKPKGGRQVYVGDQLLDCRDVSQLSLRRPIDRGYLVNFELQRDIWARAFKALQIDPTRCALVLTEPMFNFPQVKTGTEQLVFEEFRFQALYMAPAPAFGLRAHAQLNMALPACQALAGVVVDCGFSATTVVPYFEGKALLGSVRRINLGGKALGNYLKELVSYRSLNMMDEPFLMEQVKEQACFVSSDVRRDLALAAKGRRSVLAREYVLPDGVHNLRGFIRDPAAAGRAQQPGQQQQPARPPQQAQEQALLLTNERFMVPEALFRPSDVGLDQAGVAEAVVQAVGSAHPAVQALLYSNVVLVGGTARCPGFHERLVQELRPLVPDDLELHVSLLQQPELAAWRGAAAFGAARQLWQVAMTRQQYLQQAKAQR